MPLQIDIKDCLDEIKRIKKDINAEPYERINKRDILSRTEGVAALFFSIIKPRLEKLDYLQAGIIESYSEYFQRLIKLSSPNNRKSSYIEAIDHILARSKDELILPISTHPDIVATKGFQEIFGNIDPFPEKDYLEEAIGCAENGFTRAASVLGWSAAVYRFHTKIENIGFSVFNATSQRMNDEKLGRFKRYNKTFNIRDMNEMNEVFDTDLLWVMEGMSLIDMNEHTRLRSCFDLRCQGAHPCNAPFTDYNLLSFFSDIKEIVFNNPKYKI